MASGVMVYPRMVNSAPPKTIAKGGNAIHGSIGCRLQIRPTATPMHKIVVTDETITSEMLHGAL